jgi:hypothetical protein
MITKFIPFFYAGNKRIFYIPSDAYVINLIENPEEEKKLIPILGKRYLYEGQEVIVNKVDKYIFIEREMPTSIVIFRSYLAKLINVMRSIAPIFFIEDINGDTINLRITLVDDEVNLNVVKSDVFTTADLNCYGKRNKAFELVAAYYNECKVKGVGWNRPEIELTN